MAIRFESSSSACSPMFIPPSSASASTKTLPAEDSALAGVMNSPLNMFHSIQQLQKIVTSCSNELQAGSTNQQYLVFLHVTNDQLAKIDHKRVSIGKHIRMTHHTDTNELIVKLMPSVTHQLVHTCLANQLTSYQLIRMGISFDGLLINMAGARFSGLISSKEADSSYKPECRDHKNDWPTLVFGSGLSEGLARLRVDARWWLVNSRGDVNIVIIVSIKPTERSLRVEKCCLAPPAASLPVTSVGMQACGDVMIGHRGRSVHEAIPHICGAKAIPTSLLVFHHHLELNSQSIKPTVERLSYIFHDSSFSRDPHLLTTRANPNPNRPVPTKIQEIFVTQNPANPVQPGTIAPCTVTGGSLVLEFQSLYLRAPVAPEGDVIFTPAILSEWANKFWLIPAADIVKALALGAKFVFVGRLWVWGLSIMREAGVRHVMKSFLADFDILMALGGIRNVAEIDRGLIESYPKSYSLIADRSKL